MTAFVRSHPLMSAIIALGLLFTILGSVSIVPETRQGIVVRFGKPVRIVNRYKPGEQFGATQAGLNFTIPFAEDVVWIDKRVRDVDMERQQVLSTDQRRLEVDAFARYRIVNPLRMYIAARSEERVEQALKPILGARRNIHPQRIDDAIAREGINLEPALVGREHLLALHVDIADALVDPHHVLDEGNGEVQPRLGRAELLAGPVAIDDPHRLAEADHDPLTSFGDDRYRSEDREQQSEGDDRAHQRMAADEGGHWPGSRAGAGVVRP